MKETNIERLRKAVSNIQERKSFIVNEDNSWKKEEQEKKEASFNKMNTIFEYLNEMYTCKDCKKNCRSFGSKLDDKVILRTQRCFDCLIKLETQMRIDGTYNEYSQKKIEENAKSWLGEFKQHLEDYKKQYSSEVNSYVTQDGEIEEWGGGEDKDKVVDLLDNLYTNVEKQVFGDDNKEKIDEN